MPILIRRREGLVKFSIAENDCLDRQKYGNKNCRLKVLVDGVEKERSIEENRLTNELNWHKG